MNTFGPILYAPARQYLPGLANGTLKIVGAMIKSTATEQVVAHMQPVGGHLIDSALKATATGSSLGPHAAMVQLASSLASNVQLGHLQRTVNSIRLISQVGAVASVAGVGISVLGFAMVLAQLKTMDAKLDSLLSSFDAIRQGVEGLDRKLDLLTFARFKSAADLIQIGAKSTDPSQRQDQLLDAAKAFGQLRAYHVILLRESPLVQSDLPLDVANEAYGRFLAACSGELRARMLLNDLGGYREAAEQVARDATAILTVDALTTYRLRVSTSAGQTPLDYHTMAGSDQAVKMVCDDLAEARDRIASCVEIGHYLTDHQLTPLAYLEGLEAFKEPDLLFLPNKSWEG